MNKDLLQEGPPADTDVTELAILVLRGICRPGMVVKWAGSGGAGSGNCEVRNLICVAH